MISDSEPVRIVFDPVLYRPACPLIQAAMGGNNFVISELFPAETWLTVPTKDMSGYTGTRAQLREVAKKCEKAFREKDNERNTTG